MIRKDIFLLVLSFLSPSLSADEDYDVLSREPYEYQFKVDDPKTANRFEISESGSPEIVRGSYRVDLPDGRTQIVTYEVHPDKGFDAKVTYEGTAQYPDTPDFVPSAYGPPEPIRPGYAKFKRQSPTKPEKKKIANKVREQRKAKTIAVKKEAVPSADLLTASSEKHHFQNQKTQASQKKIEVASLDDTEDSPQAEPLSLQQNSKTTHKKRRQEYKPLTIQKENYDEEIKADELTKLENPKDTTISSAHFTSSPSLDIHEAVPTSSKIPEVYQINYVSGYNGQSFASPRDAFDELADSVFSEPVQNPEVIDLETTASEKASYETQPVASYPKATIDHEISKAPQPVANRNGFLKIQHHNVAFPLDTFVEVSDAISKDNFSIHKVKSSTDNEKSVAEKNNKSSHRKKLLYTQHVKKVQDFISQKFESPKAAIFDISDDTVKNHKKRKIDVKDYYKVKESIGQKPIRNIDFLPVENVNILPTIYRSQIKFVPSVSKSNEKQEKFDTEKYKNNKSDETNVDNLSVAVAIKSQKPDQLDNTHFQTEIFRDSTTSIHTEKPDSKREGTTNNPGNERNKDVSSSINEFTNLANNEQVVIITKKGDIQEKELYQTIFAEYPPVTTRRPKFKIIRKPRIPKQLAPQAIVYQPVHRNEKIKLVYKDEGFVPEYVPRY
eukprot:TRINITY_DN570_c0_g1_i6.p1 TRINITY_DN570_c0_g1~~TRINITY_DN570_c0_g1_i6.p1  ORF type:complete len:668 (-),score=166.94 TRINITY_DN570_c0_g1_i6:158-2161(-)